MGGPRKKVSQKGRPQLPEEAPTIARMVYFRKAAYFLPATSCPVHNLRVSIAAVLHRHHFPTVGGPLPLHGRLPHGAGMPAADVHEAIAVAAPCTWASVAGLGAPMEVRSAAVSVVVTNDNNIEFLHAIMFGVCP